MASKMQLEANRANAKHSTGPKTERGKVRSRLNALKHGLTAKDIVIGEEDPNEFEALRADLEADFQPRTRLEYELIERLAGLLWRLRRIPVLEAALIKARQQEVYYLAESERMANERSAHGDRLNQEAHRRCEEYSGMTKMPLRGQSSTEPGALNSANSLRR